LYESPHRILDTLRQLAQQFGHAEVAICKELTKIHERVLYGHISTVLADLEQDVYATKGEYVIVISPNYTPPTDRQLSIEAYLIDCLTQGHDLKIAIAKVAAQYNFGKNAVYQASLHLKALLSSQ
jgi:16S rRNA (cytidine1402-2'-O)-methyltransferase